ncbi:small GTP-binding protein [Desulfotomaculum nigrificans CO-1-SRB]|uniref:Ferrous iron transport protein B n=1 Tax=Desulfotomaculum nigrificans (strain DSM 14880 / VKM B-2319 / CO-1-SRB) TaxID=868595 RepID=F6B3N4_DESCC|nr:ferrous iron transport protein B [Desulfotomaculum nigrificans]AEF95193.1 small GTP-binding protein [Desulfotomaculum nigrificans CO-1-SRB]
MSHCHSCHVQIDIPEGARRIVLVGNPNAGKSVFFNSLTGMYVDVSNYPGTTLEISHGRYQGDVVIDTPGVYGISSFNDEERVARDVILSADVVINVVNAVYLERDLFLTQQVIDTGVPVIVALNMVDEAARQGIKIDHQLLSDLLGVPVIPTVAIKKQGLTELKQSIWQARPGHSDEELQKQLDQLLNQVGSRGDALLILEGDSTVAERHGLQPFNLREEIYLKRRQRVNQVVSQVVKEVNKKTALGQALSRLMIKPLTGVPILLLTLYAMYQIIGVFVAGTVVGFTEETIMIGHFEPFVRSVVGQFISEKSALGTILIGEFGLLTMTFTYVLGLLMPLVIGFYFFLSLFEDSGYLPRIATLVDRVLTSIGLNGRAVIPLILGFGCVTMATITTRLLGSERERRIAIFLLGLVIPCSAQLGVISGMLASVGPAFVALYTLVILSVLVVVGTLMNSLLSGQSSDLLIDLPPLRLPRISNVVTKTSIKSYQFLKEAFPLFALGALLISTFQVSGILAFLQNALSPLTVSWLGLPKEAATAFIMGIVRRDFGAAGLAGMPLTPIQTVVSLITITLFVPCIASILVMFKERSKKEAAIMWLSTWVIAFLIGGTVNQLATLLGTSTTQQILTVMGAISLIALLIILAVRLFKGHSQRPNLNQSN